MTIIIYFVLLLTPIQGQDKKCRQTQQKEFLVVYSFPLQKAEDNAEENEAADVGLNTADCITGLMVKGKIVIQLF